jgi:hypothetical protein
MPKAQPHSSRANAARHLHARSVLQHAPMIAGNARQLVAPRLQRRYPMGGTNLHPVALAHEHSPWAPMGITHGWPLVPMVPVGTVPVGTHGHPWVHRVHLGTNGYPRIPLGTHVVSARLDLCLSFCSPPHHFLSLSPPLSLSPSLPFLHPPMPPTCHHTRRGVMHPNSSEALGGHRGSAGWSLGGAVGEPRVILGGGPSRCWMVPRTSFFMRLSVCSVMFNNSQNFILQTSTPHTGHRR